MNNVYRRNYRLFHVERCGQPLVLRDKVNWQNIPMKDGILTSNGLIAFTYLRDCFEVVGNG